MFEDGRLCDVLIEEIEFTDPVTGLRTFGNLEVWADKGMLNIIKSIPGVVICSFWAGRYSVFLDPRYDREWVKAEIEARIKIGK